MTKSDHLIFLKIWQLISLNFKNLSSKTYFSCIELRQSIALKSSTTPHFFIKVLYFFSLHKEQFNV